MRHQSQKVYRLLRIILVYFFLLLFRFSSLSCLAGIVRTANLTGSLCGGLQTRPRTFQHHLAHSPSTIAPMLGSTPLEAQEPLPSRSSRTGHHQPPPTLFCPAQATQALICIGNLYRLLRRIRRLGYWCPVRRVCSRQTLGCNVQRSRQHLQARMRASVTIVNNKQRGQRHQHFQHSYC